MFRNLWNQIVEPAAKGDEVWIPQNLAEIPLDEYESKDEGDQEHQAQLDAEIAAIKDAGGNAP